MHNHRKLKSSFFLRDELYPERVLSKHKHYKKSGLYAVLKSQLLPSSSIDSNTLGFTKSSKMLLEGIPQLYLDNPLDREQGKPVLRETGRKPIVDQRGLQEMESLSFTNGLLESGHRYFRVT